MLGPKSNFSVLTRELVIHQNDYAAEKDEPKSFRGCA